jgi:hypothetical protein
LEGATISDALYVMLLARQGNSWSQGEKNWYCSSLESRKRLSSTNSYLDVMFIVFVWKTLSQIHSYSAPFDSRWSCHACQGEYSRILQFFVWCSMFSLSRLAKHGLICVLNRITCSLCTKISRLFHVHEHMFLSTSHTSDVTPFHFYWEKSGPK